jgi:3,4-dihydroxy 2-butanone 4-phosphate synthase/GTP cyclohydrolase II
LPFDSIPDLLDDIRAGRMVVILDDEDRENEGDLIMAASHVRPEDVNFMARHARGLICLAITPERAERLALRPMVADNRTPYRTAFTVSIEAARGVGTGISAADRAHTIRTAVAPDARAEDLVQPGHVFPLVAQRGGVLTRAGHTEAAVDLARLAGLEPAGVLVEILNDDGTMARRPELEAFARAHGLRIGTIADLIRHRLATEKTVSRAIEREVETPCGPFRLIGYRHALDRELHLALVRGRPELAETPLVRVQVADLLGDTLGLGGFGSVHASQRALAAIAAAGAGVLVVINEPAPADALLARLHQPDGARPSGGRSASEGVAEWRRTGLGAQILRDLGLNRIRVLGAQRRYVGLSGFGIEAIDYVPLP